MFGFFAANWAFEFRFDAALEPNVSIQTVRPGIRVAALFAHENVIVW